MAFRALASMTESERAAEMATDQGPVVQSALLRRELQLLRKEKNLTQEQVARSLEWSPSKLIRIEGGKSGLTRTDLQALLNHYGVTSESKAERLQLLNRGARETAWWSQYRGDVGEVYLNFVGFEAGASYIRHFHGTAIPGLLQTEEYGMVLTAGEVGQVEVSRAVRLRQQRQKEMAKRENPPTRLYIIDEAVIRRHVGIRVDPAIMPNQLRHAADVSEHDDLVTVRIIPFKAGAHSGLFGAFTLLEFEAGLPDLLYLEGGRAANVLIAGDDERLAEYRDAFESLLDVTLSKEESIDLMRRAADELLA